MTVFGAGLYFPVVRLLAVSVRPFTPDRPTYNTVARIPYYAAGLFSCAAGALDPLGLKLLFVSTIPAAFGGSSGLMWADNMLPREPAERKLHTGGPLRCASLAMQQEHATVTTVFETFLNFPACLAPVA